MSPWTDRKAMRAGVDAEIERIKTMAELGSHETLIEPAERHPWTLGCRTCQEKAEREVERLREYIEAVPYLSDFEQLREAARQLLGDHQAGRDIVPSLNALEDAAGFWQQGQERSR
jgi:hypothetical protein